MRAGTIAPNGGDDAIEIWKAGPPNRLEVASPVMRPDSQSTPPEAVLWNLTHLVAALGGRVSCVSGAENSVRRRMQTRTRAELWTHEVSVEGLSNLAHEVGHLLFAARLDDDHGIDYRAIPYDLERADGGELLAEELCCCAFSCAVLHTSLTARSPVVGESSSTVRTIESAVDAWFAEQFEIQPVFYQDAPDLRSFRLHVDAWMDGASEMLVRKCDLLYGSARRWLGGLGLPLVSVVAVRYEVSELWRRYVLD